MARKSQTTLRERVGEFIHHPITEVAVGVLILVSVTLLLVELSLSAADSLVAQRLVVINDIITGIFVVELSIRFWVEKKKRNFFKTYWIDLLAVIPIFRGLRFIRLLSLLRLFRVGVFLVRQLRGSRAKLVRLEYVILGIGVTVAVLMGGASMRLSEGAINPDFATIENAFWYATMTLVGSEPIGGDPQTPLGRVITLTLMLAGLTVFAIFTGTVSAVMVDTLSRIKVRTMELDELNGHAVICGWNHSAPLIIEELLHDRACKNVIVVSETPDLDQTNLFLNHPHALHVIVGDYTKLDVLESASIRTANIAVLLADESKEARSSQDRDARTVLAAMLIEKLNSDIHTTVQLLNRDNETSLKSAGVEEIIVTDEYVGNIIGSVVRNRGISTVLGELLTSKFGHQFYRIEAPKVVHGKTVSQAMSILKADFDATLIAIGRDEERLIVNPGPNVEITPGHILIVAASEKSKLLE